MMMCVERFVELPVVVVVVDATHRMLLCLFHIVPFAPRTYINKQFTINICEIQNSNTQTHTRLANAALVLPTPPSHLRPTHPTLHGALWCECV
jgi:hypothetical protein